MMSTIEGFFVLETENCPAEDKPKEEKAATRAFGSATRKRLGDISNLPKQPKPSVQVDKEHFVSNTIKEYIGQLKKENTTLMQLLADRNKIIELSGNELQKLRANFQKVQQQNMQLAQANSQMLLELNSGKDRLKALNHEVGCKSSLLKAKQMELEGKANKRTFQELDNQVGIRNPEEAKNSTEADKPENKPCNKRRKHQSNSQFSPFTIKQGQLEDKTENKRSVCLRRQSARFKIEEPETGEDIFEVDDAQFPVCSLNDGQMQEDGSISAFSSVEKDFMEGSRGRRSSIGRPPRLATKKIQSYKETPLNVKMRRNL